MQESALLEPYGGRISINYFFYLCVQESALLEPSGGRIS